MDDRSILPSERAEAELIKKEQARKEAEASMRSIRADFDMTFRTAHGRRVLAWIMKRAGYGEIILAADRKNGSIDPLQTTFAAMELNLVVAIRSFLTPELLQEIDYGRTKPSGTIERNPATNPTNPGKRRSANRDI